MSFNARPVFLGVLRGTVNNISLPSLVLTET